MLGSAYLTWDNSRRMTPRGRSARSHAVVFEEFIGRGSPSPVGQIEIPPARPGWAGCRAGLFDLGGDATTGHRSSFPAGGAGISVWPRKSNGRWAGGLHGKDGAPVFLAVSIQTSGG